MEEQDRIETTDEDVEAHRKHGLKANEEARDDSEGEGEDFELHRQRKTNL